MNKNDKLRRSNMVLFGLVALMLLYGVIYRMQTGDNTLTVFGFTIELPFGHKEEVQEDKNGETSNGGARALFQQIDELLG